jgi:hypothetical protein
MGQLPLGIDPERGYIGSWDRSGVFYEVSWSW